MRLVADVGGTNSRLAYSVSGQLQPETVRSYRNADFTSFDAVVGAFLEELGGGAKTEIAVAVAGPVAGGRARLTNRGWVIDAADLSKSFGASAVQLINDLVALGYAAPLLRGDDLVSVVEGVPEEGSLPQSLVVGIGTGFNVSPVVGTGDTLFCPRAEMGHAGLPAGVSAAMEQWEEKLSRHFPTIEHCFSGRGFAEICKLLTGRRNVDPEGFMELYESGTAADVNEAVDFYAELIGWLLRELTLAFMPTSGVFFAGSVARSVLLKSDRARFRDALSRPYPIDTYKQTPVHIIGKDSAALYGCARVPCNSL